MKKWLQVLIAIVATVITVWYVRGVLKQTKKEQEKTQDYLAKEDSILKARAKANAERLATAKLRPFNKVDSLRGLLTAVGIGTLRPWKYDGYTHHCGTDYYSIGPDFLDDLALYLESTNYYSVEILKLVLNIKSTHKAESLQEFSDKVNTVYRVLKIPANSKIINAAKNGKPITLVQPDYIESIELDQSNIETWIFKIESK